MAKVTIEFASQREAMNAMLGEEMIMLFGDFFTWAEGEGRESSMSSALIKLKELAVIHGLPTT